MDIQELKLHNSYMRGSILLRLAEDAQHMMRTKQLLHDAHKMYPQPNFGAFPLLEYLHDLDLIGFSASDITPITAYDKDAIVYLTRKGIQLAENGGSDDICLPLT